MQHIRKRTNNGKRKVTGKENITAYAEHDKLNLLLLPKGRGRGGGGGGGGVAAHRPDTLRTSCSPKREFS